MSEIVLSRQLNSVPPVFLRKNHVLIVVMTPSGKFLLGKKSIYPEGISRLLGGGMDEGEEPAAAAARELAEETGIRADQVTLLFLTTVKAELDLPPQNHPSHVTFVTHIFMYQAAVESLTGHDDVESVVSLDTEAFEKLISKYQQLSPMIETPDFAWSDYGQVYGPIHQIAFDCVNKTKK
ncbi:MAG: NUDIX domain-containing protein [bacterium]|nr:NUDIX domain-containing protein [bacterium]